ncbi:MAG: deoxynucleoside kinase [Phycisphaerae bacterium]|nr:deoxynucleoside kinase [Phycisphaerae bacterium]
MSAKLISIIGPVAVGKTTLAKFLARELPAEALYEDYEGNPFLTESFEGFEELALPSQLYFLFSRIKQLSSTDWPLEGLVVSDYGYCQDRMYAEAKLIDGDDRLIYEYVRRQTDYLIRQPSVVVHLDAAVETLLERIEERGREFESVYTAEYLEKLRQLHFDVSLPEDCAKISVNCEQVNLLDASQREKIIEDIREALR